VTRLALEELLLRALITACVEEHPHDLTYIPAHVEEDYTSGRLSLVAQPPALRVEDGAVLNVENIRDRMLVYLDKHSALPAKPELLPPQEPMDTIQ